MEINVRLPAEASVPAVGVTVPNTFNAFPNVTVPAVLIVKLLSRFVVLGVPWLKYKVPPEPKTFTEEVEEPVIVPVPEIEPLMVRELPFRFNPPLSVRLFTERLVESSGAFEAIITLLAAEGTPPHQFDDTLASPLLAPT